MTRSGRFRCSSALSLPRTSLARALMGSRNVRRAGCQVLPSPETPAATDQAMDMRVEDQLLGPGVQNGEHADGTAHVARVAGEFDDRGGAGLHQQGIAVALIGA